MLQELVSAWERSSSSVPSVQGLSSNDASEIKEAVMELYRVREYFDENVPEFAASITAALQESLNFPATEAQAFEDRLKRLLTITTLGVASRAAILKREYERKFCTARILTDARPVYVDSPSSPPSAMMIMHNLRITFHDDTGEMREVYIAMDDDDLMTLRGLVDRAEEKTKSLQSVFATANIPVVTE
jgi:elongation factor P hydroxylase